MSIHIEKHIASRIQSYSVLLLVGGLEHGFYDFPYIGNVIIPTDELIFFRGVETTNQNMYEPDVNPFNHITTSRLEVLERTSPTLPISVFAGSEVATVVDLTGYGLRILLVWMAWILLHCKAATWCDEPFASGGLGSRTGLFARKMGSRTGLRIEFRRMIVWNMARFVMEMLGKHWDS